MIRILYIAMLIVLNCGFAMGNPDLPSKNPYQARGRVCDTSGNGLPGATIEIRDTAGRLVQALVAGDSGLFTAKLPQGEYRLLFRFLGHENLLKHIRIEKDSFIGDFALKPDVFNLEEVVIAKKFIRKKGAGYTVSLIGNPLTANRDMAEILGRLPDVSPNLKISTNQVPADVYVNGRKLKMPQGQIMQYLQGLPGKMVKEVKVLPQNTIRQGGESKGGGIYITLRRGDSLMMGNVNFVGGVNTEHAGANGYPTFYWGHSGKKLSFSTTLSAYGGWQKRESVMEYQGRDWTEKVERGNLSHLSLSWDNSLVCTLTERQEISLGLVLWSNPFFKEHLKGLEGNAFNRISSSSSLEGDLFARYDWEFGKKGSSFHAVVDGFGSLWRQAEADEGEQKEAEEDGYRTGTGTVSGQVGADFVLRDNMTLSAGADYLHLSGRQRYRDMNGEGIFDYRESIAGIYAEYVGTFWEKLDITAGFRYENAVTFPQYKDEENERNVFHDWFPTLDIGYRYGKKGYFLNGGYVRTTDRPKMRNYEPYISEKGIHVYATGSHVMPQYDNKLYLSQIMGYHSVSLSYTWGRNSTVWNYYYEGDALVESLSTIAEKRRVDLSAKTAFWIVKKWLQAQFYAEASYTHYADSRYGKLDAWAFSGFGQLWLLLPHDWQISIDGYYASPQEDLVCRYSDNWNIGCSLRKEFGDNWSLQLSMPLLFYDRKAKTESLLENDAYAVVQSQYFQRVVIRFSYRFGNQKAWVRKAYGIEAAQGRGKR